jgi:hypothetical protein
MRTNGAARPRRVVCAHAASVKGGENRRLPRASEIFRERVEAELEDPYQRVKSSALACTWQRGPSCRAAVAHERGGASLLRCSSPPNRSPRNPQSRLGTGTRGRATGEDPRPRRGEMADVQGPFPDAGPADGWLRSVHRRVAARRVRGTVLVAHARRRAARGRCVAHPRARTLEASPRIPPRSRSAGSGGAAPRDD